MGRARWLPAAAVGLAALVAACGSATPAGSTDATASAAGLRLVSIGNFNQPVFVSGEPNNTTRLYVVQRRGSIVVLDRGHRHTFLDITPKVNSGYDERGLLSVAFSPDYPQSGRFYVYYTGLNGDIHIVQYRRSAHNADRADPGSARAVISIPHSSEPNHDGGQLQFGPDGFLYFGVGDGGGGGDPFRNAQNTDVLLGKLERIDPRPGGGYSIPATNPFAGRPGKRGEIWAYGLRNPYRFSFDRLTGDETIGDVGQDAYEEIDFAKRGTGAGENYGWSLWEGNHRYRDGTAPHAVFPVIEKSHSGDHFCAIIGGYVVRDKSLKALYGRYVYGDNCASPIRSAKLSEGQARGDRETGLSVSGLSSFGEDTRGHVYAASLQGPVYRLAPR